MVHRKSVKISDKTIYTLIGVILLLFVLIFGSFLIMDKLFVYTDIGSDTLHLYWPYYSDMQQSIKEGAFSGWSFNIGMGANRYSLGAVIRDPFNLVLILFGQMHLLYGLVWVMLLKILLSGIFFYLYISEFCKEKYGPLVISIIYAFNGYTILWGQHYHFATLMVLSPLVLYAFEKWMNKRKWVLFTISISLMAIYSSYFLYMLSIYLFMYGLFRYLILHRFNTKEFFSFFSKSIALYVLGVGISALVFLPSSYVLANSTRLEGSLEYPSFFKFASILEYSSIMLRLFSNNLLGIGSMYKGFFNYYESPILYTSVLSLVIIPNWIVLLEDQRKRLYGLFIVILSILLINPFFSHLMSAFKGYTYRWTFIIILFLLFMSGQALDYLEKNMTKEIKPFRKSGVIILILIVQAAVFVYTNYSGLTDQDIYWLIKESIIACTFIMLYTFILLLFKWKENRSIIRTVLLAIVIIEVGRNSYLSVNERALLPQNYLIEKKGYLDYSNDAISYIKTVDQDFYRVDKNYWSIYLNDSLIQDYKGLKAYNSTNNPSYVKFLRNMDVPLLWNQDSRIDGVGPRIMLQTLAGVRYYLSKNNGEVPYGYEYINHFGNVEVYKNKYALPLGFTYDTYITQDDFIRLSKEEKDRTLLQAFITEEEDIQISGFKKTEAKQAANDYYSPVMIDKDQIKTANMDIIENTFPNRFEFYSPGNEPLMMIPIDNQYNHLGFLINFDVESEQDTLGQLFWKNSEGQFSEVTSKTFDIHSGKHTYTLFLQKNNIDGICLGIGNKIGRYVVDNFSIATLDLGDYEEDIQKLKEEALNIRSFTHNYISGDITLSKDKLLFLSIPYDKGWSLKVDGEDAELKRVNIGFMGALLTKGSHHIELIYQTPYQKTGGIISCISIGLMATILIYEHKNKRKYVGKEEKSVNSSMKPNKA